jgi:hypothetical protein
MDEDDSESPQDGDGDGHAPTLGLDAETHRALGSTIRRRVLDLVLDDEREWSRGELATALAESAQPAPGASTGPADRDRLLIVLHHDHLPRLDDAGLLSYDPNDGTVSPEPVDDAVLRALRRATGNEYDD